jgi:two-component system alkaline phosphatase synthesis response regulator PhoP/two-component system response regulator VicR
MNKKKILVIDDEPAVHRLLQIILEDEGFHIVGLDESEETRRSISKGKPDLIILDIMMPELDGFDVLRMLKGDEETQDIPVIILSARNRREDMDKAKKLGADIYLTKPFQPTELLKAVRSVGSSQSANRR